MKLEIKATVVRRIMKSSPRSRLTRIHILRATFRFFDSEDIVGVLFRAPFMIILIGIIGTFAGFYLALSQGGDIKSGASVAIISSLVGLPVSLFMEYLNTLFPDEGRYRQAFNKFKVTLEMLFNHEQELNKGQVEGEMELALSRTRTS